MIYFRKKNFDHSNLMARPFIVDTGENEDAQI